MTLKWNGDEKKAKIKTALAVGGYITMEQIIAQSVKNAPRDTGTLRNSHTISIDEDINAQEAYSQALTGPVVHDAMPVANVSKIYGSVNTPYAHKQHEDLHAEHPKEGGPKYLEKAWNEKVKNFNKNVIAQAKKLGLV